MMKLSEFIKPIFFLCSSLLMLSCMGSRQSRVKKLISRTDVLLSDESARIAAMRQKKDTAFYREKIDSTIDTRITRKLNSLVSELDSVREASAYLADMLTKRKEFRKQYETAIVAKVNYLENFRKKNKVRLYKINVIDKAIDVTDKKQYDLAGFFASGKYLIPKESQAEATIIFSPVIDSVVNFTDRYDSVKNTATIVINGYADATGYAAGSELEKVLLGYLNQSSAPKAELNRAISELRAKQITMLLTEKALLNKWKLFKEPQNIGFEFYGYGQGETLPSKTIKDYGPGDPRRRIVLIYWIVLPD